MHIVIRKRIIYAIWLESSFDLWVRKCWNILSALLCAVLSLMWRMCGSAMLMGNSRVIFFSLSSFSMVLCLTRGTGKSHSTIQCWFMRWFIWCWLLCMVAIEDALMEVKGKRIQFIDFSGIIFGYAKFIYFLIGVHMVIGTRSIYAWAPSMQHTNNHGIYPIQLFKFLFFSYVRFAFFIIWREKKNAYFFRVHTHARTPLT